MEKIEVERTVALLRAEAEELEALAWDKRAEARELEDGMSHPPSNYAASCRERATNFRIAALTDVGA